MKSNELEGLSEDELAGLEALEDRLGRGASVRWDQPKTIRGILARPIETVTTRDFNDPQMRVDKRVATLRTVSGLEAIWEGPSALERLFAIAGSGVPVIVAYLGERVGHESGRPYKSFDVIVGVASQGGGGTSGPAGGEIPFRAAAL